MSVFYTFTSLFSTPIPLGEGTESAVIGKVVIPRIQRPYAQGRSVPESVKVRKDFLSEIFAILKGEEASLDLNFIYGKVAEVRLGGITSFEMQLLDGQQRMTTLFLLHWYLLNREQLSADADSARSFIRALTAFSYETRETTTKFCQMLASHARNGRRADFFARTRTGEVHSVAPSRVIRSSLSYVHSFDADPTIDAMLTMLDAIDEKYNETCAPDRHEEYWRRVDNIHFFVLSLTKYKLSEELYIKMNARGLSLSPFDCFKADFIGLMDLPSVRDRTCRFVRMGTGQDAVATDDDAVTFKQYFSTKLDSEWCDLFWRSDTPDSYDESYMMFFSRYFAARYILEHERDVSAKSMQKNKNLDILFFHALHEEQKGVYHGIGPFARMIGEFGSEIDYFSDLANLLNVLMLYRKEILSAMKPLWLSDDEVQPDYFCDGTIRLQQMPLVTFASVVEFVRQFPGFPLDVFRLWMKCVNNVVENTNIDSYAPTALTIWNLARLIRAIAQSHPANAVDFYAAMASVPQQTINAAAVEEEVVKASRIVESKDGDSVDRTSVANWMRLFDSVSQQKFLKGMIGFYYAPTMTYSDFKEHFALVGSLFDEDGIRAEYREPHHYFLRALMAQVTTAKRLANRYLVENNNKKYLKNFISALTDDELRGRMHDLFSVRLLGKSIGVDDVASEEVLNVFKKAIAEAPRIPESAAWDMKEVLRIIRTDESFYKWVFDEKADVRIYWYCNQYSASADRQWSRVMVATFRLAENFAQRYGFDMQRKGAVRSFDGYDEQRRMFVGSEFVLIRPQPNCAGVDVVVRFYCDGRKAYPVEVSLQWQKGSFSATQVAAIRAAFCSEAASECGEFYSSRINTWYLSDMDAEDGRITWETLASKVSSTLAISCAQVR